MSLSVFNSRRPISLRLSVNLLTDSERGEVRLIHRNLHKGELFHDLNQPRVDSASESLLINLASGDTSFIGNCFHRNWWLFIKPEHIGTIPDPPFREMRR